MFSETVNTPRNVHTFSMWDVGNIRKFSMGVYVYVCKHVWMGEWKGEMTPSNAHDVCPP